MNCFVRKQKIIFCLILVLVIISGCTTIEPLILQDTKVNLVWPPPPDIPRVKYLRSIYGPEDIKAEKSSFAKVLDLITGESGEKLEFETPSAITTDNGSVIYIADTSTHLIHRYDIAKRESSFISKAGEESFSKPVGLAVDHDRNLYVSDSANAKVYIFNNKSEYTGYLGKDAGEILRPGGIAINSDDEKFVVDVLAHKLKVFDKNNKFIRDFPDKEEQNILNRPTNVAIDNNGDVYITDSMNFTVRVFDRNGKLLTSIGQLGDSPGSFARPRGVAVDSDRHVYILDAAFDNMQIFNREGFLLLFIGKTGPNPGEFYMPSGMFIDRNNQIFVADTFNRRVQIFQYITKGDSR